MVFTWNPAAMAEIEAAAERVKNGILHEIAQDAVSEAPRDTGEMAATIAVDEANDSVSVGSDHWQYVEYGTENQQADPFMRRALYTRRTIR